MSIVKKCSKCYKIKPINEFHGAISNRDGISHFCKECKNIMSKNYRTKRKEEYIKKNKPKQQYWCPKCFNQVFELAKNKRKCGACFTIF